MTSMYTTRSRTLELSSFYLKLMRCDRYAAEERYKHVYFARIDVDKYNDTAKATDVRKMPTFQIYKDGVKIEQIFEPKPKDLSDFFEKHLLEQ